VIDPKRQYHIVKKKYRFLGSELNSSSAAEFCFLNEFYNYAKVRLSEELRRCEKETLVNDFVYGIQKAVVNIMTTSTAEVLSSLHDALDEIDLSLSQDDVLRSYLPVWRERFGLWRQDLLHSLASIQKMLQTLDQHKSCPTCGPHSSSSSISKRDELGLGELKADVDDTLARVNSTFQVIMSTMSIVESQKAIIEAETVSHLTALAFFFIPLTFVASIFSMNLVVSCLYQLLASYAVS